MWLHPAPSKAKACIKDGLEEFTQWLHVVRYSCVREKYIGVEMYKESILLGLRIQETENVK